MRKQLYARENFPIEVKLQIERESHGVCAHCGRSISRKDKTMTIEHIIPLHKGGTNEPGNLTALCEACNVEKGDDIIDPREYYPFLPKERRKSVYRAFDNYLKTTDCFACDTLFLLDRFSFTIKWRPKTYSLGRGRRIDTAPKRFRVEKMKKEDAMDAILMYSARLSYEDKQLFPGTADELVAPYYKITSGDAYYGFCSPVIRRPTTRDGRGERTEEKAFISMEMFFNPDLKLRDDVLDDYWNLGQIINGIIKVIRDTLSAHHGGTAITLRVTSPSSDKTMYNVWDYFVHGLGWDFLEASGVSGGKVAAAETTLYIGDSIALQKMAEELHGTKSISALVTQTDAKTAEAVQDALLEKMEGHGSIEAMERRATFARRAKKKKKKKHK